MKVITGISLAVMMVFLFSMPNYGNASKNLLDTTKQQKGTHFSKENLDNLIIAQGRRPGPRGRMSGPRGGMAGPRGKPLAGKKRQMVQQRRMQGQGQSMDQNSGQASMDESSAGTSEMQSDQSMGQVESGSQPPRRGPKFRKNRRAFRNKLRNRMQKRMRRQRMQGQGQQMGQDGGEQTQFTEDADSSVSDMQSAEGTGEINSSEQSPNRRSKFRNKRRKFMRNKIRQRMQRRGRGPQGQGMDQSRGNGIGRRGGPPGSGQAQENP